MQPLQTNRIYRTTADTTASISHTLFSDSKFAELMLRAVFFGLNLLSNAIMWILFTRALTAASSTTRVSVLNTSANFLVTAVYGLLVFGEGLSWEWALGAALLVGGCVVIGRRKGGEVEAKKGELGEVGTREDSEGDGAIRLSGEERRESLEGGERDYVDGPGEIKKNKQVDESRK